MTDYYPPGVTLRPRIPDSPVRYALHLALDMGRVHLDGLCRELQFFLSQYATLRYGAKVWSHQTRDQQGWLLLFTLYVEVPPEHITDYWQEWPFTDVRLPVITYLHPSGLNPLALTDSQGDPYGTWNVAENGATTPAEDSLIAQLYAIVARYW